jgi:hypothetical protein
VEPIGIARLGATPAQDAARVSRASLDRTLSYDAELTVAECTTDAIVLGAFQRGAPVSGAVPLERRGSGGPSVTVGRGTVHVMLTLAGLSVLVPCDPSRIVNRYVRPLLRALTKLGVTARYFGRDWVSVSGRPAAWVGFAHVATSQRTLFEAFVSVTGPPFAQPGRPSFLGKAPGTLESILGKPLEAARFSDAIIEAYTSTYARAPADVMLPARADATAADDPGADPPWAATVTEAIGEVGAGPDRRGCMRVGGDLLVSRDALARLEERLEALDASSGRAEIARLVEGTLAAPGVALDGVRSLDSITDVILRARGS